MQVQLVLGDVTVDVELQEDVLFWDMNDDEDDPSDGVIVFSDREGNEISITLMDGFTLLGWLQELFKEEKV